MSTLQIVKKYFDLTCDVTSDPWGQMIWFSLHESSGLSYAVWVLKFGPVISKIWGGGGAKKNNESSYRNKTVGLGLKFTRTKPHLFSIVAIRDSLHGCGVSGPKKSTPTPTQVQTCLSIPTPTTAKTADSDRFRFLLQLWLHITVFFAMRRARRYNFLIRNERAKQLIFKVPSLSRDPWLLNGEKPKQPTYFLKQNKNSFVVVSWDWWATLVKYSWVGGAVLLFGVVSSGY